MDLTRPRVAKPWWVELGLWGVPYRILALIFFWFSLLLVVLSGVMIFVVHPLCVLGGGFLFAALWYYLCIQWMDENEQW
jgi:hypothetical protein